MKNVCFGMILLLFYLTFCILSMTAYRIVFLSRSIHKYTLCAGIRDNLNKIHLSNENRINLLKIKKLIHFIGGFVNYSGYYSIMNSNNGGRFFNRETCMKI